MEKFTTVSTSMYSERVLEPIIIEETLNTRRIFIADINITKVADIAAEESSEELLTAIEDRHIYTDRIIEEHLYSTENLLDEHEMEDGYADFTPDVLAEVEQIHEFCKQHNCAYFRITFN